MSDKNKNTDESEGDDEENVTSKGSFTDNKKTDPSQTLDLGAEFCEEPPSDPERMLKKSKARIKAAVENYAELGLWFSRVRRFGLWRYSKRPKFKSFTDFYKYMGYSADQVSHQIAISMVLRMLLKEFGKSDVKVNVYHATVLLRGVRNKEVRFNADGKLACEIFRTVLAADGKVTGKLLKKEMEKRGLVKEAATKPSGQPNGEAGQDSDGQDDESCDDGMSLGDEATGDQGDAEEKGSNAASGEDNAAAAAKAAAVAQAVRQEIVQARTIATDLIEEVERSLDDQKFRPRLIELRSLLEEIEKQLGN